MAVIDKLISDISSFVWGVPMLFLLVGTHIFLTFRLKFIQGSVFKAIKLSISKDNTEGGDISQFGALATALAATIGTGNIIGVSTAIALGGPGAVFWTWLTGVLGMATKYAEALLSVQYRQRNDKGNYVGGPMYVLEKGLNLKGLAIFFALCTALATFGTGGAIQSKAISGIINSTFNVPKGVSGIVITVLTGLVIIGGVKKLSAVCEKLVPFMAAFYIIGSIAILFINRAYLGQAFSLILSSAFTAKAAAGGFVGSTIIQACRYGVARGLFSNESGLGTAPIVSAAAKTRNSVRQALVAMTGTFWDTVIVCAFTGLVIVSSVIRDPAKYEGAGADKFTEYAFSNLGSIGSVVLAIALSVFAYTTILGWSFYGEKAVEYIFGSKGIIYYRVLFLAAVLAGTVVSLDIVWNVSDLMNGLMAFPNLISLLCLSGVIVAKTKYYLWEDHLDEEEFGEDK